VAKKLNLQFISYTPEPGLDASIHFLIEV